MERTIKVRTFLGQAIDIFTQMTKGRKFEENYLKDNMKW